MSPHHGGHHVCQIDGCPPDGHRSDPTLADLNVGDAGGGPVVGRLRRLEAAATDGPWGQGCLPGIDRRDNRVYGRMHDGGPWPKVLEADMAFEDATLIAHMRNALPALLDIAEAARPIVAHGYSQGENGWVTNAAEVHDLLAALARLEETG